MKHFSFEEALYQLKLGNHIARAGWNGKYMHLFLVPEGSVQVPHKLGGGYPIPATVWMKTADNYIVPWLCSQTDLLANDWEVIENPMRQDQIQHV